MKYSRFHNPKPGCRSLRRALSIACAWAAISALSAWACGPFFPNSMLAGGDAALLRAPPSHFDLELTRIRLPEASFTAVRSTNSASQQTFAAELADLRAVLEKTVPEEQANQVCAEFGAIRHRLREFADRLEEWQHAASFHNLPRPRPNLEEDLRVPAGLPPEFADYLAGSIAFYRGDTNGAQQAWERLLARPERERQLRSTWAAFMLGKTWLPIDVHNAAARFEQVRALAKSGFADALGLAAASYGWQAKGHLEGGDHSAAIRLYLAQFHTGDPTAITSLRLCARKVLDLPQTALETLASDAIARQVITAYWAYIRGRSDSSPSEDSAERMHAWLAAVKNSGASDVEAAGQLALAAYQHGFFDLAEGWLRHAPADSPMAQWIRAKLLLRAGKVEAAAQLLAQVVRLFPRDGTDQSGSEWDGGSPLQRSMGELGVLYLARRQFYEALDTLLRAGYWSDAAYIAEYVLAPDELMAYVDRQWPAPEPSTAEGAPRPEPDAPIPGRPPMEQIGSQIRYLAARRLARLQRWTEAADLYPVEWRTRMETYVQWLQTGDDESISAIERAQALWEAAQRVRHEGMELFGTEVEPDWRLFDGQFDWHHISAVRSRPPGEDGRISWPPAAGHWHPFDIEMNLAPGSAEEQRRIRSHQITPNTRFHYRYLAADLAWKAAQLMPDDADQTARVLWTGGTWLKDRDPNAADRFYKALVRRCGQTALGQEADRLRWFPKFEMPPAREPPQE